MARLTASTRAKLPDSAFAYIDSRGKRRLPIQDEAHVRNALSRFNQVTFEDDRARERARKRLLQAAKKYGIVPIGFIDGQFQRERKEADGIKRDLKEAQKIQTSLLPVLPPCVQGFSLTGVCCPSRSVGGDWYDFLPLPDGRMAVVLADVSGKGMGAALLMSSTRSVLRMVAADGRSPGEVLAAVNRVLVADLPASKFVTMIYAVLDPVARTVAYANAGHLPPILVEEGRARSIKFKPELPLGVREGTYTERVLDLPPGSTLILYSDGVVEARDRRSEEYGEERVLDYARDATTPSAQDLLDDVRAFMRKKSAIDDITIVMVESMDE